MTTRVLGDGRQVHVHRNDGLRKLCDCSRRKWAKCDHPWYFSFKPKGRKPYRFNLDRKVGRRLTSKTEAQAEADRIRSLIRDGKFDAPSTEQPLASTLTLAALFSTFRARYLESMRPDSLANTDYQIRVICRTVMTRADGTSRPLGGWLAAEIATETLETFREVRKVKAPVGTNRDLSLLRTLFNWATSKKRKLVADNPFRDGDQPAISLPEEPSRSRRLHPGERERLQAACAPHLRNLVQAALETGCRKGELLTLQWSQVRFEPKAEIFLPAEKTKTKRDRRVPISLRLRPVLEMLRYAPDGKVQPPSAYVFGNEVGEPRTSVKRAWEAAVLRAHGHTPSYIVKVETLSDGRTRKRRMAALTPESRALLRAIDLNFHDLRREAGSAWLDMGVPLHKIQRWLGHSNISQTSTYLQAGHEDDAETMDRYELRRQALQGFATRSETGVSEGPPPAAMKDTDTQKALENPHPIH